MSTHAILRRARRFLAFTLLFVVAFLVAYGLAALVLGLCAGNRDYRIPDSGVTIYVRSNGVHTDLLLPIPTNVIDATSLPPELVLEAVAGQEDLLAFGWGDRRFYLETPTWSDLRLSTALRALTGLDESVLHVEAVRLSQSGGTIARVRISELQYKNLVEFIHGSFARTATGQVIPIVGARFGLHDRFFEARGHYSMFSTCNDWARRGLAAAGVRVPLWAPFDVAIFYQLNRVATP